MWQILERRFTDRICVGVASEWVSEVEERAEVEQELRIAGDGWCWVRRWLGLSRLRWDWLGAREEAQGRLVCCFSDAPVSGVG